MNECKICKEPRQIGRRLCRLCHNKQKTICNIKKSQKNFPRAICQVCKKPIIKTRKTQKFCKNCYIQDLKTYGTITIPKKSSISFDFD